MLKLKRKLQFRGHVYFQAVRPELIQQVLNWLKVHNPLYKDIIVNINNIDHNLTALHNAADNNTSNNVTTDPDPALKHDARENDNANSNEEGNEDPLNEYRAPVSETCLESVIPYYPVTADDSAQSTRNEVYSIAPGENKHPLSFMCKTSISSIVS